MLQYVTNFHVSFSNLVLKLELAFVTLYRNRLPAVFLVTDLASAMQEAEILLQRAPLIAP